MVAISSSTLKITIRDRDLAMKAMGKAFKVGTVNFKASSHFENEYKITNRQIAHLVRKIILLTEISLQPIIDEFRNTF